MPFFVLDESMILTPSPPGFVFQPLISINDEDFI